ncbi:MAG: hypothetical protein IT376_17475 [Polyangiaceae bacterium]|nr:hypothetical protein [Polyangiaceae bacterium]
MIPSVVIVLAVAVGAVAGFLPGWGSGAGPFIRGFALVAALGVAALQLLPESVESLGLTALATAAAGYGLPELVGRFGARVGSPARAGRLALEVGWAALLAHQLGDGLALGAMSGGAHAGHAHGELVLALAAHTVPLATMTVLTFRERFGYAAAALRAAGLAVATIAGIAAAGTIPVRTLAELGPVISGVVAGGLVHLAIHQLPSASASRGVGAPLGAAVGLAVAAFGALTHADEHPASSGARVYAAVAVVGAMVWVGWHRRAREARGAAG